MSQSTECCQPRLHLHWLKLGQRRARSHGIQGCTCTWLRTSSLLAEFQGQPRLWWEIPLQKSQITSRENFLLFNPQHTLIVSPPMFLAPYPSLPSLFPLQWVWNSAKSELVLDQEQQQAHSAAINGIVHVHSSPGGAAGGARSGVTPRGVGLAVVTVSDDGCVSAWSV